MDGNAFIQQIFQVPFHNSSISAVSRLVVSYRDDILKQIAPGPTPYGQKHRGIFKRRADAEAGKTASLLYQTRLASPFDDVLMHFTVTSLPLGPGATLVHALVVIIPALLLAGMFGVYRLTTQQIKLAEARQDFVSAVSHELKTPLTSIRMYGEMLRSGWVQDDAKRQTYYDFIFFESERLSRLVANVLHLARLSKNDTRLQLKPYAPTALLDLVRSKVDTQIEAAGFSLEVVNGLADADDSALRVEAEEDAFTRIFINLVDNALKFSANAEQKVVRLELHASDSPRPQVGPAELPRRYRSPRSSGRRRRRPRLRLWSCAWLAAPRHVTPPPRAAEDSSNSGWAFQVTTSSRVPPRPSPRSGRP